jgi:hypothetical protein
MMKKVRSSLDHFPFGILYKSHNKWCVAWEFYGTFEPSETQLKDIKKKLKTKEIKVVKLAVLAYERESELQVAIHNTNLGPLVLPEPTLERTYSSSMPETGSGKLRCGIEMVRFGLQTQFGNQQAVWN